MHRAQRPARRPFTRAGALALLALAPAAALVAPAHADPAAPTLRADVTVSPPKAPTEPLVCDYNRISCGTVTVVSSLSDLDAVPVGHYVASLSGTMHVRRVYSCEDASGRRLRPYDTAVEQDLSINTRRGVRLSHEQGETTIVATDYAFLDDAQPGTCPAGTTPHLNKIAASRIHLDLQVSSAVFGYRVPGTYSWSGDVATAPATT